MSDTTAIRGNKSVTRRLTAAMTMGEALDGYDLGIISVVMVSIVTNLGISTVWAGLIAASSLIGIFIGGPVFGWLSDRYGRRRIFLINLIIFTVAALAQGFAQDGLQLFIARLVLGLAIGAEYAIGAPLLAELTPKEGRGRRLGGLEVAWYVGFLAAVAVSYIFIALGIDWRFILMTAVIPSLATLVLRVGVPESPRWLMSQSRTEEARRVIEHVYGPGAFDAEELVREATTDSGFRGLLAKGTRKRLAFVCIFWSCLVTPYFAIFTFAPVVLEDLNMSDPLAATLGTNGIAVVGAIVGVILIERLGRRKMLIGPFWIMAAALGVLGIFADVAHPIIIVCFLVFAFFNAFAGTLTGVYPSEVLPTASRTTGVGVASAASRVGAAIGTFLLPLGLETIGTNACMLIGGGVCVVGAIVSQAMAPETGNLSLAEASRAPLPPSADEDPEDHLTAVG